MPLGLDAAIGEENLAVLAHDERRSDDPAHDLPVVLLLAEGAVRLHDVALGIAGQWEVQGVAPGELLQGAQRIRRNSDDRVSGAFQGVQAVAEVARLGCASGRHRLGVEVDDHALVRLAQRLGQPDVAVGAREGEIGRNVADVEFDHATILPLPPRFDRPSPAPFTRRENLRLGSGGQNLPGTLNA